MSRRLATCELCPKSDGTHKMVLGRIIPWQPYHAIIGGRSRRIQVDGYCRKVWCVRTGATGTISSNQLPSAQRHHSGVLLPD